MIFEQDSCSIEKIFHIIGLQPSGLGFPVHCETLIGPYELHYVRTVFLMGVRMSDNQPLWHIVQDETILGSLNFDVKGFIFDTHRL